LESILQYAEVVTLKIKCFFFSFFLPAYNKEELEAYQYVEQLAYLITEKVKFLGEGKDPVSPVQIMGIQIEVRSNLDMTYKWKCKSH
jgi:hypothetical protein